MGVQITTRAGPVNRGLFLAALSGTVSYLTWPASIGDWPNNLIGPLFGWGAFAGALQAGRNLVEDYRLRRNIALAEEATTDHGSAREATWEEIVAAGMDDPASGNFRGLFDGKLPVFGPVKTPFAMTEMTPGAGKTVALVTGVILHQAMLGKSVVVADPKLELAPMLAGPLRALGFEVWAVNPTRQFLDRCGEVEVNLYQMVLDAAYAEGEGRRDAPSYVETISQIHFPPNPDEKNPYFGFGSRRCLSIATLSNALIDPRKCTPAGSYELLVDPKVFLKRLEYIVKVLAKAKPNDPLVAYLKGEAENLLHRAEHNEENFGAFLEGATQRLLPYNPAGRLAGYGQGAIHSFAEIRERQVIVFMMNPLSHKADFAPVTELCNRGVIEACKQNPTGHPVHIVAEEALNYRFKDLDSDLEVLRGLGVTADFFIQSFAGLERLYGKTSAQAIEAYMDVKIYGGITSLDRARFISDMLSEATIRHRDYSFQAMATGLGVSSREQGRRLMQPNEILTMPRNQVWMFVRGMNPMRLTMAHYGQIAPWRDWVEPNPLNSELLRSDPLFEIHYPQKGDVSCLNA